jgi:hypothetical protein
MDRGPHVGCAGGVESDHRRRGRGVRATVARVAPHRVLVDAFAPGRSRHRSSGAQRPLEAGQARRAALAAVRTRLRGRADRGAAGQRPGRQPLRRPGARPEQRRRHALKPSALGAHRAPASCAVRWGRKKGVARERYDAAHTRATPSAAITPGDAAARSGRRTSDGPFTPCPAHIEGWNLRAAREADQRSSDTQRDLVPGRGSAGAPAAQTTWRPRAPNETRQRPVSKPR